jgi:hypothetical protein
MFRAYGKTSDNRPLVIMGITEDNVKFLKLDKPILFDMASDGSGMNGKIAIVYRTEQYAQFEERLSKLGIPIFVLDDQLVDVLRQGKVWERDFGSLVCNVSLGKSEEELYNLYKDGITPETKVKTTGFSPSDKRNFEPINN